MARPTDGGNASNPSALPVHSDEDAPYVPRVFAFDPTIPARLIEGPDQIAVPEGSPARAPEVPPAQAPEPSVPVATSSPETAPSTAGEPAPETAPMPAQAPAAVAVQDSAPDAASQTHGWAPDATAVIPSLDVGASTAVTAEAGSAAPTEAMPAGEAFDKTVVRASVLGATVAPAAGTAASAAGTAASAAGPEPTRVLPAVDEAAAPAHPVAEPWSKPAADATQVMARPVAASQQGAAQPDAPAAEWPFAGGSVPPTGPPNEPMSTSPKPAKGTKNGKKSRKKAVAWSAAAVVVLAGLYVGAQWYFSDKVPRNTSVAGVQIGGETKAQATKELNSKLASRIAEPIVVTAAGESAQSKANVDPKKAGLTFDAAATVDPLASFSLDPTVLWRHLAGGNEVAPVIDVDTKALNTQIASLKNTLDVDAIDGSVTFENGQPKATKAVDGIAIDTSKVRGALVSNWLVSTDPVALATKATSPTITQAETDAAMVVAKKAVSAPVVVTAAGQSAQLPVDVLASTASFKAQDGTLVLTFDGKALEQAVVERTTNLLTPSADAHFEFVNGAPKIVAGTAGTTLDNAKLASAVATASQAAAGSRTATMELTKSDPTQSTEKLQKLGIKEKISEFSTPLTSEPIRTKNLIKGASKVNGTLVLPGATFSLTDTLSPITIAGGYYSAGIISEGVHTDGVGGGLSQLSTTTYNAAYFAGVDLVEHQPHSYWFPRYPAGRESTMAVGSIDMKFKNDTPYGMLLQASVSGGRVHVAIWSTKYYDVKTSDSGKQNVKSPGQVTLSGPDCISQGPGQPGFTITNYRKVYLNGKLVKNESWPWTYKPDNAVKCQ